jgi:hypothetical protein
MKLLRCYACLNEKGIPGFDFEADDRVCPRCNIDGKNPRFEQFIVTREVVHFDAPVDHPMLKYEMGVGFAACNEKISIATSNNVRFSGDPRAVNCPRCRETDIYKKVEAELDTRGVIPERDTVVKSATTGGGIKFAPSEEK